MRVPDGVMTGLVMAVIAAAAAGRG